MTEGERDRQTKYRENWKSFMNKLEIFAWKQVAKSATWQESGVGACRRRSLERVFEKGRERESGLSAMPLQPSFQIRAATSLENVTFSWSRQGRDGGSGKGGVGVVEDKW